MKMHELAEIPPWDWPPDADAEILSVLRDREALSSERLLAAQMAGDLIIMNDALAEELLRILGAPDEPDLFRGQAAIAFGPALEEAEIEGSDHREFPSISASILQRARDTLRASYEDPGSPKEVRRRALEASIRAPEPWHAAAVRTAYRSEDAEWKLTAVFCMRFVDGFDDEIVEALESEHPDILHQAVLAAGDQVVPGAWHHIRRMVFFVAEGGILLPDDPEADRDLTVAAIEAVARIRPLEASETLNGIIDLDDEDLSEVALDALDMVQGLWDEDDEYEGETTWH